MTAFDNPVRGPVCAASNYSVLRLAAALVNAQQRGSVSCVALQVHYNPVHRNEREGDLAALCHREGLSCIAYSALADGFLTGKYRPGQALPASKRAEDAAAYLTDSGLAVLGALDSGRVERGADRGGGAGLAGRPAHGGRTASQCQDPQTASRPPASAGPETLGR